MKADVPKPTKWAPTEMVMEIAINQEIGMASRENNSLANTRALIMED